MYYLASDPSGAFWSCVDVGAQLCGYFRHDAGEAAAVWISVWAVRFAKMASLL